MRNAWAHWRPNNVPAKKLPHSLLVYGVYRFPRNGTSRELGNQIGEWCQFGKAFLVIDALIKKSRTQERKSITLDASRFVVEICGLFYMPVRNGSNGSEQFRGSFGTPSK